MALNEQEMYDRIYAEFRQSGGSCGVSCHELDKAERKVTDVMRSFAISSLRGARALDVGCGLGYFSEALRRQGAEVTALDSSVAAIDFVRETFPGVTAVRGLFPDALSGGDRYDLIWACDFSLLNHFDVDRMYADFYCPALDLLTEDGVIVVGWHTNFGGTMGDSNFAHWSLPMIRNLKRLTGLTGPRVVSLPGALASRAAIRLARALQKSIPIYIAVRRGGVGARTARVTASA